MTVECDRIVMRTEGRAWYVFYFYVPCTCTIPGAISRNCTGNCTVNSTVKEKNTAPQSVLWLSGNALSHHQKHTCMPVWDMGSSNRSRIVATELDDRARAATASASTPRNPKGGTLTRSLKKRTNPFTPKDIITTSTKGSIADKKKVKAAEQIQRLSSQKRRP